jgi:deoxyribodipyrimidine photo-lyase
VTALVWLRRDLRIHDHPALRAALRSDSEVAPVFCFDDGLLKGRHASGPRTQFLLECLVDLDRSLRDRGGRLFVRRGPPQRVLPELARAVGATRVHYTQDVSPFARRRQREVGEALAGAGVEPVCHPGLFAVDSLRSLRTAAGDPYTIFTPFHRAWLSAPRREVLNAPRALPAPSGNVAAGRLPSLADLGLTERCEAPMRGGEGPGREALMRFLRRAVAAYDDGRDELSGGGVSRLSAYLHFGCLSPREIERRLGDGDGPAAFRRQLCWRDFYAHVLGHFPANARSEYQRRYRGRIRWSHAERRFAAWCEGRTGYPLVDAGMRQLRREGWMHNRARLVVGSFLTKDLGIDWRWGERWFMRWLLDGDEASNNGNWQWIASVGVDPQPAFRRIFNPARQQQRFDPAGVYVRRHVPELAQVPSEYLAEPWKMPAEVQEAAGCRIGRDYPAPLVDHAQARREALERYRI